MDAVDESELDVAATAESAFAFLANPALAFFSETLSNFAAIERAGIDAPQWVGYNGPGAANCAVDEPFVEFVWPARQVYGPPDEFGVRSVVSATPVRSRRPRDRFNPNRVCVLDKGVGGNVTLGDPASMFYNGPFRPGSDANARLLDTELPADDGKAHYLPSAIFGGGLVSPDLGAGLREIQRRARLVSPRTLYLQQFGVTEPTMAAAAYDPVAFQAACAADPYCTAEVRAALNKTSFEAECALVAGCAERLAAAAAGVAPNPFVVREQPMAFDLGSVITAFAQGSGSNGSVLSGDGYATETTSGEGVFDSIGAGLKGLLDIVNAGAGAVGAIGQAISPFVEYNQGTVYGPPAPGQSQPMATGGVVANGTLDANALKSLADLLRRNPGVIGAIGGTAAAYGLDAFSNGGSGPINATNLTRTRPAGQYLPSRIQVMVNGQMYILANLGRATHGSREKSVAKRLAKDNGLVCRTRGYGGGRRRRPR